MEEICRGVRLSILILYGSQKLFYSRRAWSRGSLITIDLWNDFQRLKTLLQQRRKRFCACGKAWVTTPEHAICIRRRKRSCFVLREPFLRGMTNSLPCRGWAIIPPLLLH